MMKKLSRKLSLAAAIFMLTLAPTQAQVATQQATQQAVTQQAVTQQVSTQQVVTQQTTQQAAPQQTATVSPSVFTQIGNLQVSPNPYNPTNGFLNLNYSLSNVGGDASVTLAIYSSGTAKPPLKSWSFNSQSNGSNSVTWNGKDSQGNPISPGSYLFHVSGQDGASLMASQQISFTVIQNQIINTCAGFSDVSAQNADCPAIEYVKSTGAMTGNPDGTFGPEKLLQRDQIIKIVLLTFNKFNPKTDYCVGIIPFTDVTSASWSYQYICQAKELGIATGYLSGPDTGFYRPVRAVERIEFLALVLRNLTEQLPANNISSYKDVPINQWYSGYAKFAYDENLFNKPNLFPSDQMLRIEVARALFKLHQLGKI
jgi:hypothetical protein